MINLNKLAKEITLSEGLKKSVSITQVKEIMRLVFTRTSELTTIELAEVIKKYKKTK